MELPAILTHALYGAAMYGIVGGFGEGFFIAALAAVLVDLDSPGMVLHSPLLLTLAVPLLLPPLRPFLSPVVVGVASHLFLDLLTRRGVMAYPGKRVPRTSLRRRLPTGDEGGLNMGISAVSAAFIVFVVVS